MRAYLAARWLKRLRSANCPLQAIHDLLFAEVYENALIRPAARVTAAWLSLWDSEIVREVIARDPMLLMDAGDPASLSPAVRADVLQAGIDRLIADAELRPIHDHDKLRRFTTPELSGPVRTIWVAHHSNGSVRELLLMMIWLGRLAPCVDLALDAALMVTSERIGQLFAGRAVATLGDATSNTRFANHIRAHAAQLSPVIVWDAAEHLFPGYLSVGDLLTLLDQVADENGYGFRRQGADFAAKLESSDQLIPFIEAILDRARRTIEPPGTFEPDGATALYGPGLATAAMRLMKRSPDDQVPMQAVDAYLWLNKDRHPPRSREVAELSLKDELCRTSARRRIVFWRTAERLNGPSPFHNNPLTHHFQLEFFGWPGGLELNDLDWLLQDMPARALPDERQLALSAAHWIWKNNGSDTEVLTQIAAAARLDPTLAQLHDGWLSPQPEDEEMQRLYAEMAVDKAKHEADQAKRDASWRQFVDDMRADTAQIRKIEPRADNTVDGRLYNLWKLAKSVCAKDSKFAFDSLAPIEPVLGADLTEALSEALIRFWRSRRPILRTDRAPEQRNLLLDFDCMAIAAVSLEANRRPAWATALTFDDAALAVRFATLELNGFPPWLSGLANGQPAAVASVLVGEVAKELDESGEAARPDVLDRLTRAEPAVVTAVALGLLNELEARVDLAGPALETLLGVLVLGLQGDQAARLSAMALDRAATTPDLGSAGEYFAAAFASNPSAAIDRLIRRLDDLSPADQTALATAFLPKLFGDHFFLPSDAAQLRHPLRRAYPPGPGCLSDNSRSR